MAKKIKREIRKPKKSARNKVVSVVGLGYVGLPLAVLCAEKGLKVYGIDKQKSRVKEINNGINPLSDDPDLDKVISNRKIKADSSFNSVAKSDVVVVCVPTPVDKVKDPDLYPLETACREIAKKLKNKALVIIESTIYPGVCQEIVQPIMEKFSNLKAGKDFYLAHSPERINPGDKKWKTVNIPRVVGALSRQGLRRAISFYKSILDSQITGLKSIKEAEATKVLENSFRDINIAFVNELAKSFAVMGIDIYNVLEGASTKPFAFLPHWPSVGVGGHCIPVDPYYLIKRAGEAGFDHKFLKLAREINNSMPSYTAELLFKALNEIGKPVKGTKVGILGVSYKANVGDLRESPSLDLIKILRKMGADLAIFDPYLPKTSTAQNLNDILKKCEAIILATAHNQFFGLDALEFKRNKVRVIIDGQNFFDKDEMTKAGIIYKGIGR